MPYKYVDNEQVYYLPERLLKWIFKVKAYNSMPIIILFLLFLKNLICIFNGIIIVYPLIIFDFIIDVFMVDKSLKENKSVQAFTSLADKDLYITLKWVFNKKQAKVRRQIDYCLIQFLIEALYLGLYVNQFPSNALIIFLILFLLILSYILMFIFILSNLITIYSKYESILKPGNNTVKEC